MAESKEPGKKPDAESSSSSENAGEGEQEEDVGQIGQGVATAKITISREEYLQALKDITTECRHLQVKNNILHRRLAEYYRKRKLDHVLKPFEGAADLEEKYQQKLIAYLELKEKAERETADIWSKVQIVENQYMSRNENADAKFTELQSLERTTGTGLIYSRKGKPIADKTVARFLTLQKRKAEQASALCLRYIRARNAVAELEAIVKKLEILGPGLYVYQYEQLNIDFQNYTAKIEEREDELIRNRAKCTEHNQILAHIREKMHHTDEVIDLAECDLGDSEIDFSRAREDLGVVKARRNKLRWLLEGERQKAGLLTRKDLLRDFQTAIDKGTNHYLRFDKPQILAKEHRFLPSMLREAIEIKKHPNFNREDGWNVPPAWDPVIQIVKSKKKQTTARLHDTLSSFCVVVLRNIKEELQNQIASLGVQIRDARRSICFGPV